MRLLVVEDNEELAQLLNQRLRAEGYESDVLATATEARAAVSTTRYAALILDLLAIRQATGLARALQTAGRGRVRPHLTGLAADPGLIKRF